MSGNNQKTEKFCYVPWASAFISPDGMVRACAQNFRVKAPMGEIAENVDSPRFRSLRRSFNEGREPRSCSRCFDKERLSQNSLRTRFIQSLTSAGLKNSINTDSGQLTDLFRLDLSVTNRCNLHCRTCGPYASSKWADKINSFGELDRIPANLRLLSDNRIYEVDIESVVRFIGKFNRPLKLYLEGGEPMVSHHVSRLLSRLVEQEYSKRIGLLFITNGTVFPKSVRASLKEFSSVSVYVSVDGAHDVNLRIRGTKLDLVEETIASLNDHGFFGGITFTLCAYNATSIVPFLQWYAEIEKRYPHSTLDIHPLVKPEPLSVSQVPKSEIAKEIQSLKSSGLPQASPALKILENALPECVESWDESKFPEYDSAVSAILS